MAIDSADKRQAAFIDAEGMLIPSLGIVGAERAWLVGQYNTGVSVLAVVGRSEGAGTAIAALTDAAAGGSARSEGLGTALAALINSGTIIQTMSGRSAAFGTRGTLVNGAVIPGGYQGGTGFTELLSYYTVADTAADIDAPGEVIARVVTRPFDASNAPQIRTKRLAILSVYGDTQAAQGKVIGKVTWYGDGREISSAPLRAWIGNRRKGTLLEISPPPYAAKLVWAELEFTVRDIVLGNTIWEYVYLN